MAGNWPSLAPVSTSRAAVKMIPFKLPNVEMDTKMGMTHFNHEKNFIPKLCVKDQNRVRSDLDLIKSGKLNE